MRSFPVTIAALLAVAVSAVIAPMQPALADAAANIAGEATHSTDGAVIYAQVCQGCHMQNGQGGVGAGTIPALAHNGKLASASYPVYMVLNGRGGMPWFSPMLNDTQVAAVVNYVRGHFGNQYTDTVKPEDVAQQRGPNPTMEK